MGRPISGLVWLLSGGLFGIGWVIDFFLIPEFVEEVRVVSYCATTLVGERGELGRGTLRAEVRGEGLRLDAPQRSET